MTDESRDLRQPPRRTIPLIARLLFVVALAFTLVGIFPDEAHRFPPLQVREIGPLILLGPLVAAEDRVNAVALVGPIIDAGVRETIVIVESAGSGRKRRARPPSHLPKTPVR